LSVTATIHQNTHSRTHIATHIPKDLLVDVSEADEVQTMSDDKESGEDDHVPPTEQMKGPDGEQDDEVDKDKEATGEAAWNARPRRAKE
jgi:hypothetical protein